MIVRKLGSVALAIILCGGLPGGTDPAVAQQESVPAWPETCQAAIDVIVSALSEADKAELRKDKEADLIQYHHGWGTGIRNEFGLWGGNAALAQDCHDRFGDTADEWSLHPDTVSGLIIEQVWRAVGGT